MTLREKIEKRNPEAVFLHTSLFDIGPQVLPRLTELTQSRALAVSRARRRLSEGDPVGVIRVDRPSDGLCHRGRSAAGL